MSRLQVYWLFKQRALRFTPPLSRMLANQKNWRWVSGSIDQWREFGGGISWKIGCVWETCLETTVNQILPKELFISRPLI